MATAPASAQCRECNEDLIFYEYFVANKTDIDVGVRFVHFYKQLSLFSWNRKIHFF